MNASLRLLIPPDPPPGILPSYTSLRACSLWAALLHTLFLGLCLSIVLSWDICFKSHDWTMPETTQRVRLWQGVLLRLMVTGLLEETGTTDFNNVLYTRVRTSVIRSEKRALRHVIDKTPTVCG